MSFGMVADMCDVPESTVQELLLAALASPEHKGTGAGREDLLRATQGQRACIVHSLGGLRALLKNGHAAVEAPNGSLDPVSDPNSLWRMAAAPNPAEPAGGPKQEVKRIGNYTYAPAEVVGRGRIGYVVRGRNEFLHRDVAMKFLSREYTDNANFRQKFEREARILARLDHPNIVKIYDGGQDSDATYYIAMEYIDGGTLVQLTKKLGRLPPPLVAKYMYEIASALAVAHRHGILHRDVKPDNVMMAPEGAKLADFNLAGVDVTAIQEAPSAFEGVASEVGKAPQLIGTLPYMAPERTNGERGDLRSDIYSLGATLYSVAAGAYLFEGIPTGHDSDGYMNWRWHHNKETPKPLTDRVPGFPPSLWSIIERCLAKDPDQRYQTYDELLEDLAGVARELAPGSEFTGPAGTSPFHGKARRASPRWIRSRWAIIGGGLIAAALAMFFMGNPFRGAPVLPADSSASNKPVAVSEIRAASGTENAPPPSDKVELAEKRVAADAPAPKPEPEVPPRLRDKLLSAPTTGAMQASMARLLDLVGGHYSKFRTLSYGASEVELQRFRDSLPAGELGVAAPESEYLRSHLDAVAKLVGFAMSTADSGWRGIRSAPGKTRIRLADGKAFEGLIASATDGTLVISDERGQRLSVDLGGIDPRELLRDGAPAVPQLAYKILSIRAANGLGEILKLEASDEETLLWIPFAARIARLEIHETAKRAAMQAKKLLVEKQPGEDFLAQVPDYMDVLALVQSMCGSEQGVLSLYPYLGSEFSTARHEEEALSLLVGREYSRIVTSYRGTASYGPAAELLIGAFQKKIIAAHNELMAGTGWIDWDWQLHPAVKPAQEQQKYWRPDVKLDASILQDPEGTHTLIMGREHLWSSEGVLLTVRFELDGARSQDAHWKFHLRGEKGASTYLRFEEEKVALCRTILRPGTDEEVVSAPVDGSGGKSSDDRTYALIPSAQDLHLFRDGKLLLTVPRTHAVIPQRLAFSVMKGKLTLKHVQVLKK